MPDRLEFAQIGQSGPTHPSVPDRPQRCDFCSGDIDSSHTHLLDRVRRSLVCVCDSCYGLFTHDGAGGRRFCAVPQRYLRLPNVANAVALWDALQIPIGLSFLFTNGATGLTTVCGPASADAPEAALPLDVWREAERALPALATMAPDVEALLVRRTDSVFDAAIVPIDRCYELLGRIREKVPGAKGEDQARRDIDAFMARVGELASSAAR